MEINLDIVSQAVKDGDDKQVDNMESGTTSIEIVPFSEDHLEEAAGLVAVRYRQERKHNPILPARFEDAAAVLPILQNNTRRQTGMVAMREGRLIGFLTGFMSLFREVRTAFIPYWGHGASSDNRQKTYWSMYASLARHWVANGYFNHIITVLAHEQEVLGAWFMLGFGMDNIDTLRDVSSIKRVMADVEIRRATMDDIDAVMSLALANHWHLTTTPIFRPMFGHEGRRHLEQQISDANIAWWLAYNGSDIVGIMRLVPLSGREFSIPPADENTCGITAAFTKEEFRHHGVATTLLNHALEWARSVGYTRCAVDFESANILGASFWLKYFQPVGYSLVRRLDERIAWGTRRAEC